MLAASPALVRDDVRCLPVARARGGGTPRRLAGSAVPSDGAQPWSTMSCHQARASRPPLPSPGRFGRLRVGRRLIARRAQQRLIEAETRKRTRALLAHDGCLRAAERVRLTRLVMTCGADGSVSGNPRSATTCSINVASIDRWPCKNAPSRALSARMTWVLAGCPASAGRADRAHHPETESLSRPPPASDAAAWFRPLGVRGSSVEAMAARLTRLRILDVAAGREILLGQTAPPARISRHCSRSSSAAAIARQRRFQRLRLIDD